MSRYLSLLLTLAILHPMSGEAEAIKLSNLSAATSAAPTDITIVSDPTGAAAPKKITFAVLKTSLSVPTSYVASLTAPAAGLTVSGATGSVTISLANDLAALEGLSGTGYAKRTGTDAWSLVTAVPFSDVSGTPTTRSGYGITDAEPTITAGTTGQYWRGDKTFQTLNSSAVGLGSVENTALSTWPGSASLTTGAGGLFGTAAYTATGAYATAAHTHTFASLTSKPTTVLGYGITDAESALTFSTGLTRATNTITVNSSQSIATLSNLTSNGFVKTSGATGALSIDTASYLTTTGNGSGLTGIPAAGVTGTAVTQTTLSNASLPASFTTLAASGFVGIATTSPVTSLSIGGSTKATPMFFNAQMYSPNANVDQGVFGWNYYYNGSAMARQNTGFTAMRFAANPSNSNAFSSFFVTMTNIAGTDRGVFTFGMNSAGDAVDLSIDTGSLSLATAGKGLQLKSGTGARAGNAVLVGGTVTVTNTTVTANTVVLMNIKTAGGTLGTLSYTLSAGASFTINSSSAIDTSTVSYMLIELN